MGCMMCSVMVEEIMQNFVKMTCMVVAIVIMMLVIVYDGGVWL